MVHRVSAAVSEASKAPPTPIKPTSTPPGDNTNTLKIGPPPPTPIAPKVLDRPSAYLRSCCPLCFGGSRPKLGSSEFVHPCLPPYHILTYSDSDALPHSSDVHACLDATFGQKRRESAQDPDLHHPSSKFLSAEVVREMEDRVAQARKQKPSNSKGKAKATGNEFVDLAVSSAILDDCERSFLAAQEMVAKASKNFYSDTGLMALLCRHDRVLWLANLTSPGERQHYAFALLQQLFCHLPPTWTVGLLYDIACQLHRSMVKVRTRVCTLCS